MQPNLIQTPPGWPQKQGLYDPQFERDACGVGFVVNIKGQKSHQIIQQGLQVGRPCHANLRVMLATPAGLEPATFPLGGGCSIR